jgi:hypothetical protein
MEGVRISIWGKKAKLPSRDYDVSVALKSFARHTGGHLVGALFKFSSPSFRLVTDAPLITSFPQYYDLMISVFIIVTDAFSLSFSFTAHP